MIRVVIGTEANQYVPQKVLEHTIRKHCAEPVDIRFATQTQNRVGGTNFGFVRFMVPSMFDYQGKAIYLDADQIVLANIRELWEALDDRFDLACVQRAEGVFGDKPVGQHNQTSVMVMNCARLRDWDPATLFDQVVPNRAELRPGEIHYRNFMMLGFMEPARVQALDPRWNHFNMIRDDSRLVHFSHVRSQPWKSPKHPLTKTWESWLRETIQSGHLGRLELVREIVKGHIHRQFWKDILPGRTKAAA
jgi:lipopolysaccharide biosynthesis glycosyltransferase